MKAQRVVWPSRAKVDVETFALPPIGDDEVLVATECTLISPGTERAFLLGLPMHKDVTHPVRVTAISAR